MLFEYDVAKSQHNTDKHGIDFETAQELWLDEYALVVPANTIGEEQRYALIARLKQKCYVSIFTLRDDVYRIISVRRCRKNEEKNYETDKSR